MGGKCEEGQGSAKEERKGIKEITKRQKRTNKQTGESKGNKDTNSPSP